MIPPKASNRNMWFFGIAIIVVMAIVSMRAAHGQTIPCYTPSDDAEYCMVTETPEMSSTSSAMPTLTPFEPTATSVPIVEPTNTPTALPTGWLRPYPEEYVLYMPIVNR